MSIATHQKKTLSDMITTYAFAELWTNFVLSQHVLINFIGHVVVVVVVVILFVAFCCCWLRRVTNTRKRKYWPVDCCCLFLLIVDLLFSNLSQISRAVEFFLCVGEAPFPVTLCLCAWM